MLRFVALPFLLMISITAPAAAQVFEREDCDSQILASVEMFMPRLGRDVDPRDLTCLGLTQVYFLLQETDVLNAFETRQRVLAVFRAERLIR